MFQLSKVKICIFDVNGVLIDSNLANAHAMGQAFSDDPLTQQQIAAFYLTLTGIDRGEKIRSATAKGIYGPPKLPAYGLSPLTRTPASSMKRRVLTGLLKTL